MASGVTGLSSEGRVQSWDAPQGLLLEGQYATFIQLDSVASAVSAIRSFQVIARLRRTLIVAQRG